MNAVPVLRHGASEQERCRACETVRRWRWVGVESGGGPPIELWRCETCGLVRMQMANVPDADGLAHAILDEWLRRNASLTRTKSGGNHRFSGEDAFAAIRDGIWIAYAKWQPTRNPSFRSHGTWMARNALTDWVRDWLGRADPKPLSISVSLDQLDSEGAGPAGGLGSGLAEVAVDGEADRDSALAGVLARRDRDLAGEDARVGLRPPAAAPRRDPSATAA